MRKRKLRVLSIAAFVFSFLPTALVQAVAMEGADASIRTWLDAQAEVKTWAADFVQTRYLKTLKQPLSSTGQVWFATPGLFRWELGKPAQSIAIRSTNEVVLLYPRLKRAERYALDDTQKGPWREALALLDAGFPRNREQLDKQFEIVSQERSGSKLRLNLRPKAASARSLMFQITIALELKTQELLSTELTFADGSRMRNDFTRQERNPTLDTEVFSPAIPEDYKITEPLNTRR